MDDELVVRRADPHLTPRVGRFWGFAHTGAGPVRQRERLSVGVVLIFSLGVPLGVVDPDAPDAPATWWNTLVGGVDDRCPVIEHSGRLHGVQVDLSPIAARMLLRVPMHELARQVVGIEDVLGGEGRVLEERVAQAGTWAQRFSVIESMLARRLADAPPPPPDVDWAWRRLAASHGELTVDGLARELGCSRKHLAVRFREHVGLPPKRFARMLRFRRASDLIAAGTSIAHVAAECGYYDQPHLDRDFREFAATTPSAYASDAVTFLQDGRGAGA